MNSFFSPMSPMAGPSGEGHTALATRMGEGEATNLYPGTYYLCFEHGSSVLRLKRPLDEAKPIQVVFVSDPRRLCKVHHYFEEQHQRLLWNSMLLYTKSGFVDGYCLVPPQFNITELANYDLHAGRDDGLLMFLEKNSPDSKKYIKLRSEYVVIIQIVPIEETEPETTLLVSSSSEPVECPVQCSSFPLPNRFCPPWEQTVEVRVRGWRCMRLLLSLYQPIPVSTSKRDKGNEREGNESSSREERLREREERLREREERLREIEESLRKGEEIFGEESRRLRKEEREILQRKERLGKEEEGLKKEEELLKKEGELLRKKEERLRKEEEIEKKRQLIQDKLREKKMEWEEESQLRKEEEERLRIEEKERMKKKEERLRKQIEEEREKGRIRDQQIQRLQEKLIEEGKMREKDLEERERKEGEEKRVREELERKLLRESFKTALTENDIQRVQILLDQSTEFVSDPFFPPFGNTPLHLAVKNGFDQIVKILLDRGASRDAKNEGGNTPLHTAAYYKQERIIKILLEKGATIQIHNKRGETPLDVAVCEGNQKIIDLFKAKS